MLTFLVHHEPLMTTVNVMNCSDIWLMVRFHHPLCRLMSFTRPSFPRGPPASWYCFPVGVRVNKLHLGDMVLLREMRSLSVNPTNAN